MDDGRGLLRRLADPTAAPGPRPACAPRSPRRRSADRGSARRRRRYRRPAGASSSSRKVPCPATVISPSRPGDRPTESITLSGGPGSGRGARPARHSRREPVAGLGHAAAAGDRMEGALDVGQASRSARSARRFSAAGAWRRGPARSGSSTARSGCRETIRSRLGLNRPPSCGLRTRLRRASGVVAHADHAVAETQGEQGLGQAGGEGDDPLRRRREGPRTRGRPPPGSPARTESEEERQQERHRAVSKNRTPVHRSTSCPGLGKPSASSVRRDRRRSPPGRRERARCSACQLRREVHPHVARVRRCGRR